MSNTDNPIEEQGVKAPSEPEYLPPYTVALEEKTGQVFAIVSEEAAANPMVTPRHARAMSPLGLQNLLEEQGFADFFFAPNSKEKFLKQVRKHMPGRYLLGERRDAQVIYTEANDGSWARIQTTQAWGGKTLTEQDIQQAIEDHNIFPKTINNERLAQLTTAEEPVDLIIAECIPPVHGEDAELEALVSSVIENDTLDTSQIVAIDQRERYEFTFVEAKTPLMRKKPSTKGTPGLNVHGKEIPARPGRDIPFARPFENVTLDEQDENLLVASISGHPIVSATGVKIDPVLMVDAVDINSGNIHYDGSLIVKRDIQSGFEVSVSGDVMVQGTISRANVKAGGSISVRGGVLGHETEEELRVKLDAGTDISAKFLNQATVSCAGNLEVSEYIMNCQITTTGEVVVGQPTGRGCIIGGHIYSDTGVHAKVLGSDAYVTTHINVGGSDDDRHLLHRLSIEHKRRSHELEQLCKILEKIVASGHPTSVGSVTLGKAQKIRNTVEALTVVVDGLNAKMAELVEKIQLQEQLYVKVSGKVFPNVVVSIHGKAYSFDQSYSRIMLVHENNKIEIHDYPNK